MCCDDINKYLGRSKQTISQLLVARSFRPLLTSTDDRVQFSLLGHLGEIDAVLLQILAWNLRIRVDNIQSR